MTGLNYGSEGAEAALKERMRTNDRELHMYRGLLQATKDRINSSTDKNKIKEFENDIEKYNTRISILEKNSNECFEELRKIEERMGT